MLQKEYKIGDNTQQINSRAFFEFYKNKTRTHNDDVRNFIRKFHVISKILLKDKKLDVYIKNQ